MQALNRWVVLGIGTALTFTHVLIVKKVHAQVTSPVQVAQDVDLNTLLTTPSNPSSVRSLLNQEAQPNAPLTDILNGRAIQTLPVTTQSHRSSQVNLSVSTANPQTVPVVQTQSDRAINSRRSVQVFTTPASSSQVPVSTPQNPISQTAVSTNAADLLAKLQANPNPLERPYLPEDVKIRDTQALTLVQTIDLARQNNPSLRVKELELERQQAALRQQQAQNYPGLSVNSTVQHTGSDTTIQSTSGVLSATSSGLDSDQHTTSLEGNVRLDYNIFDPDRRPTIQAAERQVRQAELLLEQQREQLRLDVTEAYYDLQEADEQVRISQQAVIAAQRSLQDAQALERAGVGTRFAVLQAQVQLANEQQNLVNNQAQQLQNRRALVQILNLPQTVEVVTADPVQKAGSWNLDLPASIVLAFQNRPELEQRLVEREISEAQRRAARAGTLPTLGFFGLYSAQEDLSGVERSGSSSDSGQTSLTGQYQVGLNLRWPFFDGGASRASAKQQEISKQIAEVQFSDDRNQIRRQVEDAYYTIDANLQNIDTAQQGVTQATEALRLARLRFQAGVGTQIDVLNAERDLTQAQGNLVTATIGYNRALVRMQRAVSDFPES
jgi:OMF family outer membrane factor